MLSDEVGHTKGKLEEAKFFLKRMKARHGKKEFKYYLNAFLGSARSVAWVMRYEYHDIHGWESWFIERLAKEDGEFLKRINDARLHSVKKSSLSPHISFTVSIPNEQLSDEARERLESYVGKEVHVTIATPASALPPKENAKELTFSDVTLNEVLLVLDEFPDDDILLVCQRYYSILDSLVSECYRIFGSGTKASPRVVSTILKDFQEA